VIRLIERFAAFAAVAIVAADDGLLYDATDMAQHLRTAAESAALIERAKGIRMERHACNADGAELFITIAARQANLATATYAQALIERILHR
jgi:hypothetical protein